MAQDMRPAPATAPVVADPWPLGLAALALATFVWSAYNANLFGFGDHTNAIVIGLAIFGGLTEFMAGMWAFKNRNTFAATALSTYGAFWVSLGTYLLLAVLGRIKADDVQVSIGWLVLAFAIFNTYIMFCATRINTAIFGVFLTLEVTEILLFLGFFAGNTQLIQAGGYMGIITAGVAWYSSGADVINSLVARPVAWVGQPVWKERRRR